MNGFKFSYENGIDKGIVIIIFFLFLSEAISLKIGVRLVNSEFVYSILEICFRIVSLSCCYYTLQVAIYEHLEGDCNSDFHDPGAFSWLSLVVVIILL